MLADFLTYIREQSLFQKNEYVLLAVSSGIDSVVLAHLFHEAGFNFGMAPPQAAVGGGSSFDFSNLASC